jgi:hypothetical protein
MPGVKIEPMDKFLPLVSAYLDIQDLMIGEGGPNVSLYECQLSSGKIGRGE